MPREYSNHEYMHFIYGFRNGNVPAAMREYQQRFPQRRIPPRPVFVRIHQQLGDTGSVRGISQENQFYVSVSRNRNRCQRISNNPKESIII